MPSTTSNQARPSAGGWLASVVAIAIAMTNLGEGPLTNKLYELHKSFGVTVLALALVRLGVRSVRGAPPFEPMPDWQRRAAQASLRLLAMDPAVVRRRVVLAADVPDRAAFADPDRAMDPEALAEVRLTEAVPVAKLASVHVDALDAESDIAAAAAALGAADQGDEDARFVVDGAADHELLWYGVQEIDHLL